MSYITDVVVVVWFARDEVEKELLAPLPFDTERHQSLRKLDMDGAGGSKYFMGDVYAAAFNYLLCDEFETWIRGLPWGNDRAVVSMLTEDMPLATFTVGTERERLWWG